MEMLSNPLCAFITPFFDAYTHADIFGKLLFILLILLSVLSWAIIFYKQKEIVEAEKGSKNFSIIFQKNKNQILLIEGDVSSPFQELYFSLKRYALELLNKRHQSGEKHPLLSPDDLSCISALLDAKVMDLGGKLENRLYILSTTATLAPFLGLLGTVWGILISFGSMQMGHGSHQAVLHGLALALTTTVLGLLIAIPALIGYNILRNRLRKLEIGMHAFGRELLTHLEMQYRKI